MLGGKKTGKSDVLTSVHTEKDWGLRGQIEASPKLLLFPRSHQFLAHLSLKKLFSVSPKLKFPLHPPVCASHLFLCPQTAWRAC